MRYQGMPVDRGTVTHGDYERVEIVTEDMSNRVDVTMSDARGTATVTLTTTEALQVAVDILRAVNAITGDRPVLTP